ncbi:MAG: hypothetical protein Q9182_003259 [Xanthomendoza sp. 2 TL-2023]
MVWVISLARRVHLINSAGQRSSANSSTACNSFQAIPNFDEWHPVKVLYHYMRLRGHKIVPETQKLVETLIQQPISVLPASVRQGHEGRLAFLKRCWEESKESEEIDRGWIEASIVALDGEAWEDLKDFALLSNGTT